MGDSLFNIFGDHFSRQVGNVTRQPLTTFENMGKSSKNPVKASEPMKKGSVKKTFLSNTGKTFQSTPARIMFSPRAVNVGTLIYDEETGTDSEVNFEELEFTKTSKYNNYHTKLFESLIIPNLHCIKPESPPATPPPTTRKHSMEFDNSYDDKFFSDEILYDSLPEDLDLNLPELY